MADADHLMASFCNCCSLSHIHGHVYLFSDWPDAAPLESAPKKTRSFARNKGALHLPVACGNGFSRRGNGFEMWSDTVFRLENNFFESDSSYSTSIVCLWRIVTCASSPNSSVPFCDSTASLPPPALQHQHPH